MSPTWPDGAPRVMVSDAWLPNAGDGAIALAVERMIRQLVPGASIVHAAYHSELVGDAYDGLRFVPPLSSLLAIEGSPPVPPEWDHDAGRAFVDAADLVVSQGGGFLVEAYQPWERLFALEQVVQSGTRLVLLGQTIGTFRLARARALLRTIVRRARAVTVRDEPSYRNVQELAGSDTRVTLTTDLTISLFDREASQERAERGVAVVLTEHEQMSGVETPEARRAIAARLLEEVVERVPGEPVTVASTAQGHGEAGLEDDAELAHAVVEGLSRGQRNRVEVVDGYLAPREAFELYGRQRAVVTLRLHPALFAMLQGVPAALLLGADKARLLDDAALGALVCVTAADEDARARAVSAALAPEAPSGRTLWDAFATLRERARDNELALRQVLEDTGP